MTKKTPPSIDNKKLSLEIKVKEPTTAIRDVGKPAQNR